MSHKGAAGKAFSAYMPIIYSAFFGLNWIILLNISDFLLREKFHSVSQDLDIVNDVSFFFFFFTFCY
jgi:hypothetical protein